MAIHHGPEGPNRPERPERPERMSCRVPHHHAAAATSRNTEASGLVAPASTARTPPTGRRTRPDGPLTTTSAKTPRAAPNPKVVRPLHWSAAHVAAATTPAAVQRPGT